MNSFKENLQPISDNHLTNSSTAQVLTEPANKLPQPTLNNLYPPLFTILHNFSNQFNKPSNKLLHNFELPQKPAYWTGTEPERGRNRKTQTQNQNRVLEEGDIECRLKKGNNGESIQISYEGFTLNHNGKLKGSFILQ